MSNTLSFHHRILARGRHMLDLGRPQDARSVLEHLVSMPELDPHLRVESLRTLNQLEFHAGCYRRARRFLRQAITLASGDGSLWEQYALNIEADRTTSLAVGLKAIRRAFQIDRREPRYGATLGRLALAAGRQDLARKAFRHVARLNPTSPAVLETLVTGFLQLDLPGEAVKLLMNARVEMENSPALKMLWERLRFEAARTRQHDNAADAIFLAFPAVQSHPKPHRESREAIVRVDRGSASGTPHILRRINLNR